MYLYTCFHFQTEYLLISVLYTNTQISDNCRVQFSNLTTMLCCHVVQCFLAFPTIWVADHNSNSRSDIWTSLCTRSGKKSCKRPLQNADNLERKRSLLKVFKYDPRSSLFRRRRHMYSFVPHLTSIGRLGRPHLLFLTSTWNFSTPIVTLLQTLQMSTY